MKPGFKQTEIGVIPEDWDLRLLGELAEVCAGGTPNRSNLDFWEHGDIPWITTSEVKFQTIRRADQYITNAGLKNSSAKLLNPGTLLIALYGQGKTRGKVAILGIVASTNQACAAISVCESYVEQFLFQHLWSQYRWIRGLSNIGNQENLSSNLVRSIPIRLPPTKDEQEAIADALSDADALIDSLERLIAKKRQIKQGAMQELLTGKTRLPGFEVQPGYKSTEVGSIPVDWNVTTVGSQFSIQLGKMLDREKNRGVLKPFLGNRAVQWGRVDITDLEEIRLTSTDLKRFRLAKNDLLVCEGGEVGRCAIWNEPMFECYYQKALHRLRPKGGYSTLFLSYVLYTFATSGFFSNFVTQTSIAHLPKDKFETVPIPLPLFEEQEAIAKVLTHMDDEITALENKLKKAWRIKQGMMQELLTGRIRLV